ncbi:pentapeptide repeat-containing protein [Streptomyces sp. NPDC006544]|uniref:pentapeptide repeat-containing protein n=1 Tax=Streptomyces sp. NPDC006544 TaxID=3154583 RepID=UPI0033AE3AAC
MDPIGCRGIHVPGHTACLAHLASTDRDSYLADLTHGDDIDHRGTTFTPSLLTYLLNALRDPATNHPKIGRAWFASAAFTGDAWFGSATFTGDAWFQSATFTDFAGFMSATFLGDADFGSATFTGQTVFRSATFIRDADFQSATFTRGAGFQSATFTGDARFQSATFTGNADFESATFTGDSWFSSATFTSNAQFGSTTFTGNAHFASSTFNSDARFGGATFTRRAAFWSANFTGTAEYRSTTFTDDADFRSATFREDCDFEQASFGTNARFGQAVFERASTFGPLMCSGLVQLSGADFAGPVVLSVAAHRVECRRTRWSSTAELRLRYATLDFSHAVFEYAVTIAAEAYPFTLLGGQPMVERMFSRTPDDHVRVGSLRGVDVTHLVLADVDLSECLFTGAVHLDLLRLEGACSFARVPPRGRWRLRLAERRTLAEEHYWRASQPGALPGWNSAVLGAGRAGPPQLAPVYRALRKSFEDSKNEPGAADFYYGEMEMRRHDRKGTTRTERGLLHGYWALSGYGLRASRALCWLALTMSATVLLLMWCGIAQDSPKQQATGTIPAGGGSVTFKIDKADPQNPKGARFTGKRFEKAFDVTLNSVVFRSSGQDLTTAGTYIEMASRLTEPVLLGLAVLAVRNRVKR